MRKYIRTIIIDWILHNLRKSGFAKLSPQLILLSFSYQMLVFLFQETSDTQVINLSVQSKITVKTILKRNKFLMEKSDEKYERPHHPPDFMFPYFTAGLLVFVLFVCFWSNYKITLDEIFASWDFRWDWVVNKEMIYIASELKIFS